MNNITETGDIYPDNEIDVNPQGKQYIGLLLKLISNPCLYAANTNYISIIDHNNQYTEFEIMSQLFDQIKNRSINTKIRINEKIYIWLSVDERNRVCDWRLFTSMLTTAKLYSIYQSSYYFDSVYRLMILISNIKTTSIRNFYRLILQNTQLMKRFVSLPASKEHHHSFPGGLLIHSLETALITAENLRLMGNDVTIPECEITITAALFHDIGKIVTLDHDKQASAGFLTGHDNFTLMVLADALRTLNHDWQRGCEALQYLLTWNNSHGFCKFVGGNIIRAADRLSTSRSLRRMAFSDKPAHFYFSVLTTGKRNQCINRL